MSDKMSEVTNALNFFEIPVIDVKRAAEFYETILDIKMFPMEMPGMSMVMFPPKGENGNVGGALAKSEMHAPSETGTIVYLNANPDLQAVLDRVVPAGGKIIKPKTLIAEEYGYLAFIGDSEGNIVGLHSTK